MQNPLTKLITARLFSLLLACFILLRGLISLEGQDLALLGLQLTLLVALILIWCADWLAIRFWPGAVADAASSAAAAPVPEADVPETDVPETDAPETPAKPAGGLMIAITGWCLLLLL